MIDLSIDNNGDLRLGQRDVSPTVYLDHWALRTFSEDANLAGRLTAALGARNGTLALSWLNVAEFSKLTSQQQGSQAEALLDAILPRVFFLEVEPFRVIDREDELLAGAPARPPHGDAAFLRALIDLRPGSLKPLTARDLFTVVQNSQLAKGFDDLADTVVGRVETLRQEFDADPDFRSAVGRPPNRLQIQRGTRFIVRELVRALIVDKGTKITRNQAIDLLHAVVPVAYCDLVLLDKHWETQVDRTRSRLNGGISIPIARVFSGKAGGLDRFLCALESS